MLAAGSAAAWRRRALWALAAVAAAAVAFVALQAPWGALSADAGPLDAVLPHDVDFAVRLDPVAVAGAPGVRRLDSGTLRVALDALQVSEIDPADLGEEVACARRDGFWIAARRVGGLGDVLHIATLRATARVAGRLAVAGPGVEAIETDDGDVLYTARRADVQLVGDDPDLLADALACCDGRGRPLAARAGWSDDLRCSEAPGARVFLWCSADWSAEFVDGVLPSLESAGDLLGALAAPDEIGSLAGTLDLRPAAALEARLRWRYPGGMPGALARAAPRPAAELAASPTPRSAGHEVVVAGGATLAPDDVAYALDLFGEDRADYEAWSSRLGGRVSFAELRPGTDAPVVRTALVGWRDPGTAPAAAPSTGIARPLPAGLLLVRPRHSAQRLAIVVGAPAAPRGAAAGGDAVLAATVDFLAAARARAGTAESRAEHRAEEFLRQEERSRRRRLTVRLARQGLHGAELRAFVDDEVAGWRARAGAEALRVARARERDARRLLERLGRIVVVLSRTDGGAELRLRREE